MIIVTMLCLICREISQESIFQEGEEDLNLERNCCKTNRLFK